MAEAGARAVAVAAPASTIQAEAAPWPLLAAAAATAAIAPLWISELLPFQDAPQHLAAIRVLADYHAPGLQFEKWFEIDLNRLQYLGFYLPAAALSRLVGPDAACRICLSVIALVLPNFHSAIKTSARARWHLRSAPRQCWRSLPARRAGGSRGPWRPTCRRWR